MATRIQIRRDNTVNWTTINPILSQGELGLVIDTGLIKVGDGISTWSALAYSKSDWNQIQNKPDPIITLAGDLSGSVTLTDLGNGTLTATVADDSHNHIIANVDGLQTALDLKANIASPTFTGTVGGITKAMVGLNNVDNTTDLLKPVSTATQTALNAKVTANAGITAGTYGKVTVDTKGLVTSGTTLSASDIPSLDASKITTGTIDAARLPSYVDDVIEATTLPATGETGKIYVKTDDNTVWRWTGSAYVEISVGVGTADSAVKLATARTIALSGDVTGSVSFDGSANATITATVVDDSHNHIIANVDGLQAALDGKVDDSQVLTNVPAGAVFTDTIYTHPTTDGNLHVPATSTTNNGKVLTAGATAGSLAWVTPVTGVTDHTLLSNIGTMTHSQLETAINDLASASLALSIALG